MSVYNPDDFLFYYSGAERRARVAAGDPSFSRSSTAMRRDRSEIMREVDEGAYRRNWVEDENGFLVPANRLEAARTNSILHSEDFSDAAWTKTGLSVTADNADAPDGTTTADRLEPTAASDHVDQTVSVSDDSLDRAMSIFVPKNESTQVRLEMAYTGGTTEITEYIDLDTTDGSVTKSGGETRSGVEDWSADFYRLWLVVSNNGTGNTTLAYRIYPDQSGSNANQHAWGAQLEGKSGGADFPSSYVATAGSAVSRAADSLTFPIGFGTQDLTTYLKFVERMSADTENIGLLALGGDLTSTTGAHFGIEHQSSSREYWLLIGDGDGNFGLEAAVNPSVSIGDVVEIAARVDGGDSFIEVSVNGGTITSDTRSISHPFDADRFHNDQLVVGGRGPSTKLCMADFITGPIIAPGVKSMNEMRNLAGTA